MRMLTTNYTQHISALTVGSKKFSLLARVSLGVLEQHGYFLVLRFDPLVLWRYPGHFVRHIRLRWDVNHNIYRRHNSIGIRDGITRGTPNDSGAGDQLTRLVRPLRIWH